MTVIFRIIIPIIFTAWQCHINAITTSVIIIFSVIITIIRNPPYRAAWRCKREVLSFLGPVPSHPRFLSPSETIVTITIINDSSSFVINIASIIIPKMNYPTFFFTSPFWCKTSQFTCAVVTPMSILFAFLWFHKTCKTVPRAPHVRLGRGGWSSPSSSLDPPPSRWAAPLSSAPHWQLEREGWEDKRAAGPADKAENFLEV